ncbi:MAG: hypothetical protein RSD74_03370 [Angelakisella sp.]
MVTTKYKIAKFFSYGVVATLLCVLQNTPGLFAIYGTKPMLVVSFAICVAIFERETAGGLFAVFAGLLCDLFSSYSFGYYALLLFFCCVAVGLLTQGFMRPVAVNAMLFTLVTMVFIQWVGFFFTILIWVEEGAAEYFFGRLLPFCIYTAVMAFPLYYLARVMHLYFEAKIEAA